MFLADTEPPTSYPVSEFEYLSSHLHNLGYE